MCRGRTIRRDLHESVLDRHEVHSLAHATAALQKLPWHFVALPRRNRSSITHETPVHGVIIIESEAMTKQIDEFITVLAFFSNTIFMVCPSEQVASLSRFIASFSKEKGHLRQAIHDAALRVMKTSLSSVAVFNF